MDQLTSRFWQDNGIEHIDMVFHLGAFIPKNAGSGDSVAEIFRDNLQGTHALLESLPNAPEKVVFSSTIDVYGLEEDGGVLTEQSRLDPPTLYGASKLFCEHLIKAYSRKCGCGHALLRFGHIYGPGEGAYAKLIPQVIRALLRNESPVLHGDGQVLRDFMFVGDAIEATIRAATSREATIDPVNIASGTSRPIREYVEIITTLVGFSGGATFLPGKPGGRSLQFSNDRMFDALGHWELHPLEDGLRQEIDYFRRRT